MGLSALGLMYSLAALGHGGGLDPDGCHQDGRVGDYHCHSGPFSGKSFASRQEMLGQTTPPPVQTPPPGQAAPATSYIPDRSRTPGAINPAVTQENIQSTICVAGWTKTIRPPTSYTDALKKRQLRDLGLENMPQDYHEDHLVPLCVGGHPSDERNLWSQPGVGRWTDKIKDQLESSVCRAVCRGGMTLEQGQAVFLSEPDWTKAYLNFFGLE